MTSPPSVSPEPEPEPELARVLLVEDEAMIRALLADQLRQAGMRVIEAANADEALAYLQSAATVDLLFSDVQMPGSINGADLAERVRDRYPSIRIILSSGAGPPAGYSGSFLAKPYDFDHAVSFACGALGLAPPEPPCAKNVAS